MTGIIITTMAVTIKSNTNNIVISANSAQNHRLRDACRKQVKCDSLILFQKPSVTRTNLNMRKRNQLFANFMMLVV